MKTVISTSGVLNDEIITIIGSGIAKLDKLARYNLSQLTEYLTVLLEYIDTILQRVGGHWRQNWLGLCLTSTHIGYATAY